MNGAGKNEAFRNCLTHYKAAKTRQMIHTTLGEYSV